MAISEDTAAIVAAQLTVAWSNLFAGRSGTEGLNERQVNDYVEDAYARMLAKLRSKDALGYSIDAF